MQKYVYIETYGCSANQNNSEILAGLLKQAGFEITSNEKIADIIIINSCIVKGKTENKIKRRIQDIARIFPAKLCIITGCMPETDAKQLKQLNSNVLLLGTHHFKQITTLISDFNHNQLTIQKQDKYLDFQDEDKLLLPKIPHNKLISIVQISEGCLGKCTYCKTRLAKGRLFSYPQEKIIETIKRDLQNGAKEIWITSQDNASYGLDKGKPMLPGLLKNILELKGDFKLRLGMMNPNNLSNILEDMIKIYSHKKLYKFLHIPIQSASDPVLKNMNRPYKIKQVEKIINRFRKEFPDITIATDIITGYPTETQKDHEKNLDFINKFKPDVFNLSKFSKHKGTAAANLKEIPIDIINKRTTELMQLHRKTALENKQKFLGKEIQVFANKKIQGFYEARDDNYNIILLNTTSNILGKKVKVKIKQVAVHHMLGEILNKT
jgi:MiaB-like tRNA modifying enzyme